MGHKWLTAAARGALFLLALSCGVQAANAARVTSMADNASVKVGEEVLISVFGADFQPPLDGGGLNVQFPSALLQLDQVTIDPIWNFATSTGTINNQQGTLTGLSFNASPPTLQNNFKIASLEFTAKSAGSAVVNFEENNLFVFGSGGIPVSVDFGSAAVSVSVVPEPSAVLLLLCGLGVLSYTYTRRNASRLGV